MIKPYNTNQKITKQNSTFNSLPSDYEFHQLKNQFYLYETQILLNTELPLEPVYHRKNITDVFEYLYNQTNFDKEVNTRLKK